MPREFERPVGRDQGEGIPACPPGMADSVLFQHDVFPALLGQQLAHGQSGLPPADDHRIYPFRHHLLRLQWGCCRHPLLLGKWASGCGWMGCARKLPDPPPPPLARQARFQRERRRWSGLTCPGFPAWVAPIRRRRSRRELPVRPPPGEPERFFFPGFWNGANWFAARAAPEACAGGHSRTGRARPARKGAPRLPVSSEKADRNHPCSEGQSSIPRRAVLPHPTPGCGWRTQPTSVTLPL